MSLREELEAIAEAKGLEISPHHAHKIEKMEEDRVCRCDRTRSCPCEFIDQDLAEWGSCMCRVLVTPERLEKQSAYYAKPKVKKVKKPRVSIPVDL
jgi:ferredoxin-thioredoxin reductase catalytic subunit